MTNHAALVQALLATCDRLGMTNIPADAPAAFARVLGDWEANAKAHGVLTSEERGMMAVARSLSGVPLTPAIAENLLTIIDRISGAKS